eukprot:357756-Chlamydomonas_euryale.AAC.5
MVRLVSEGRVRVVEHCGARARNPALRQRQSKGRETRKRLQSKEKRGSVVKARRNEEASSKGGETRKHPQRVEKRGSILKGWRNEEASSRGGETRKRRQRDEEERGSNDVVGERRARASRRALWVRQFKWGKGGSWEAVGK